MKHVFLKPYSHKNISQKLDYSCIPYFKYFLSQTLETFPTLTTLSKFENILKAPSSRRFQRPEKFKVQFPLIFEAIRFIDLISAPLKFLFIYGVPCCIGFSWIISSLSTFHSTNVKMIY